MRTNVEQAEFEKRAKLGINEDDEYGNEEA